jgi:ABC-type dipeptide/oligopeptide/nickel transport system permease component
LSAVTIASLAAIDFPAAFTGACVAERVFNLPGIGRDVTAAVAARNVPLLMAFGVCAAALTAFLLVAADVACARLDPRCRRTLLKEPG